MHTAAPSTFDFTTHPTQTFAPTKTGGRKVLPPSPLNLIRDVYEPHARIVNQTSHSLSKIASKKAKTVHTKIKSKNSKPASSKASTTKAKAKTKKATAHKISKHKKLSAIKKTTKKESREQLSGRGFNIRHF